MDKYDQIDKILEKYGLTQEVEPNRKKVRVFFNGKTAVMETWKAHKLDAELTTIDPYLKILVQDVEDK